MPALRALLLHNRYKIAGGEDEVVNRESALLRDGGVEVEVFQVDNDSIVSIGDRIQAAVDTFYSRKMFEEVSKTIDRFRPDVVHVHNFVPRLSPSVYDAARKHGCAVVQTLHNYRLICANAQLFRDEKPCCDCVGLPFGWPGILHKCYRNSALGSAVLTGMTSFHRVRGTWLNKIDRYIVLTHFARDLFVRSGRIPPERIILKPNFAVDSGVGVGGGNYFLYVGRLSQEKGIQVLLQAALNGDGLGLPLKIAGSGPLESLVKSAICHGKVEFLGSQNSAAVCELMKSATALLCPSLWYEGALPLVIIEAFSTGLPVVASNLGAMAETFSSEQSGLLVEAGSVTGFQAAARRILTSPELLARMRQGARAAYEFTYSPQSNLTQLLEVYKEAIRSGAGAAFRPLAAL